MHGIADSEPLWRVTRFDHLRHMVSAKANVMVRPSRWEDPFENFLGNCSGTLPDGTRVSLRGIYGAFYGQCWTSADLESDAAWRTYVPDGERGARVRVSAGKLFDTIFDRSQRDIGVRAFLVPVTYMTQDDLVHELATNGTDFTLDPGGLGQGRALSLKREAFAHEQEVRLLYNAVDVNEAMNDRRSFRCDPNALIEDIVLDPRYTEAEAEACRRHLESDGYTGNISHSTLYRIPSFPTLRLP